jgi:TPR repeat protein
MASFSIALEGDRLVVSGVGDFGHRRRVEIPVAAIEGYCIEPSPSPDLPWDAFLVVAWREGGARKHEKAPILRDGAETVELIAALRRLRPDANLLDMPVRQALKKLGVRSVRGMIAGLIVAGVVVSGGIMLATGALKKRPPAGDHCGNLPVNCLQAVTRYLGDPEEAPAAARELDRACGAGDLSACAALGPFLVEGAGVAADARRAHEVLDRACSGGVASGCNNLGVLYSTGRGTARDEAKGTAFYRRACDLGDVGQGCYNVGSALVNGLGVERDEARGASFLERACNAGESNGCLTLGVIYWEGRGVPMDRARARRLFEGACRDGNERACTNLRLE